MAGPLINGAMGGLLVLLMNKYDMTAAYVHGSMLMIYA
jgi:hypothetical protein